MDLLRLAWILGDMQYLSFWNFCIKYIALLRRSWPLMYMLASTVALALWSFIGSTYGPRGLILSRSIDYSHWDEPILVPPPGVPNLGWEVRCGSASLTFPRPLLGPNICTTLAPSSPWFRCHSSTSASVAMLDPLEALIIYSGPNRYPDLKNYPP